MIKVTGEFAKLCDKIAEKIFKNKDFSRRVCSDIESVRYTTEKGSLIVCRDGEILFAEPCVETSAHKMAFRVGLRSDMEEVMEKL